MQTAFGGPVKEHPRPARNLAGTTRSRRPDHDVEFRREDRPEFGVAIDKPPQGKRCFPAASQVRRESAARHWWQQALGRPQRDGRGTRARAFKADLPEVQVGRGEIGISGVMNIELAYARIGKQNATATVRLEPVLMRVHDNRVGIANPGKCVTRICLEIIDERKIAAVRGIDMDPATMIGGRVR